MADANQTTYSALLSGMNRTPSGPLAQLIAQYAPLAAGKSASPMSPAAAQTYQPQTNASAPFSWGAWSGMPGVQSGDLNSVMNYLGSNYLGQNANPYAGLNNASLLGRNAYGGQSSGSSGGGGQFGGGGKFNIAALLESIKKAQGSGSGGSGGLPAFLGHD